MSETQASLDAKEYALNVMRDNLNQIAPASRALVEWLITLAWLEGQQAGLQWVLDGAA